MEVPIFEGFSIGIWPFSILCFLVGYSLKAMFEDDKYKKEIREARDREIKLMHELEESERKRVSESFYGTK